MNVRRVGDAGVFVLDADEGLNEFDATDALAEVERSLEECRVLVLDCEGLVHVNSAAVSNMLRLKAQVVQKGGKMRLASLQPQAEKLMELVRGNLVFDVYESVEKAMADEGGHEARGRG